MNAEIESTIPINLIRPRLRSDGQTPPPDVDVEFVIALRQESEANLYAGVLDDSPSGIFVPTYRQHRLGTIVAIALDLPGREELIVINTVVRWVREPGAGADAPPGIGLEFLHIGSKTRARLDSFARRRPPLLFED